MNPSLFSAALALLAVAASAAEFEPIKPTRSPALSPDGRTLAFSYAGDIWLAPAEGGAARPLTLHEAHDTMPVWAPDGKTLAFASNRTGDYDVWIVSALGGRPSRLTWNSAVDVPCDFTPDGKQVLVRSSREPDYPGMPQLYLVPVAGGTPKRVTRDGGSIGAVSAKGDSIVYTRGFGATWRRNYRGSADNDLWTCRIDGSENRRLTDFNGDDNWPMTAPDGRTIYFVSDRSGRRNLWRMNADGSNPKQLTHHDTGEVRRARISRDGSRICYEFDWGVWVFDTSTARTAEVRIDARPDDKINPAAKLNFTGGATEMELSPDGRQIALVVRGEVFVMAATGGTANRITNHPANDYDISWSPDGKKLLFVSDRSLLKEEIFVAESDDAKRPDLSAARKVKTTKLSEADSSDSSPAMSPDGKYVLFQRGDGLWVMDAGGKNRRQIAKGPRVFNPIWSPDSKWLAYVMSDPDYGNDIYISVVGGGKTVNVTRWGTAHNSINWSLDGRNIVYAAAHGEDWNVYAVDLLKPIAEGEVEKRDGTVRIDFDNLHRRIRRVVNLSGDEQAVTLSPNGRMVAFRADALGGQDLWMAAIDGTSFNRLAAGINPNRIVWARDNSRVLVLDGAGTIKSVTLGGPTGSVVSTIGFSAVMEIDRAEEFHEMFHQAWRMLRERFYDPAHHGVDWQAVHAKYDPLVRSIVMKEDFYDLMLEMLGELNASHLGISGSARNPGEPSGYLGLEFDPAHSGAGLKISGVLPGGPCDRRGLDVKAGDFLLAIDGKPVGADQDLDRLLLGTLNKTTVLTLNSKPAPAGSRDVDVKPVSGQLIGGLEYDRWVARNNEAVEKLGKGRLGYVHMSGMDMPNLEKLKREIYSDNRNKDALVLDLRFNGGGFTHDYVLDLLGGKVHTHFVPRGSTDRGSVLRAANRKWNKPVVVLINERSASDAEIFPAAFRKLGMGKLVGRPTMGAVIGTYNTRLIDGSTFRIPQLGVFIENTTNLENFGVKPDHYVENTPDGLAAGRDDQLDKAIEVLLGELTGKPVPTAGSPARADPPGGSNNP